MSNLKEREAKNLKQSKKEENLREIFSLESPEDVKEVKIIRDGDQFSIKIPRAFAREMDIDPEKDHFRFILLAEESDPTKKMLNATLEKHEKTKKTN
ncbi:hypothetical protein LCGC14_1990000 [marine sediment metagenome]|uniref:Uncharacterized protein n=1 Tax=marine sediment metagenome TaxID=412755 RepID=A0A0F9F661_9ZZZZ